METIAKHRKDRMTTPNADVCGDVRLSFAAKVKKVTVVSNGVGEAEAPADNETVA